MAGTLPAPVPPPQTTSPHHLQATNPLTFSSSNQIQQIPPPSLLRPSDPAAVNSDRRPEPAVPAPILALPAHNPASAPACPSPELAPPSLAISGSATASASAPASHQLPAAPEAPPAVPPESASASPPLSSSLPISPPLAEEPLSAQRADLLNSHPPVRRNAQVNPPHLKSYAQAAKGAPGPGFVRAHARDVDSFARLPRTGINVICGTREGIPVFSLVQSDMLKVEGLYAKALVMKFHGGRPSLAASHKEISCWGLESPFSIGPLTSRSFLLRFQDERDLLKILTRPSSTLITFPYKIFRWHSRCHKNEDSVKVPVWISLPRLPLQCFAPEFLESIANRIGRFLCLDKATATLARPSTARMCIELDLREARPQFVLIDLFEGHKQTIVYERVPKFCSGCHVQGHTNVECSKTSLDTLQSQGSDPLPVVQERPQPVRRNAKEISATVSQVNPLQSRAPSVAASTAYLSASDLPQQDPSKPSHQQLHPLPISPVAPSSAQQSAVLYAPLPHPPPPTQPDPSAAAPHLPSPQSVPLLFSSIPAAVHPVRPLPHADQPSIKQRSNTQTYHRPSSLSRSLSKLRSHHPVTFKDQLVNIENDQGLKGLNRQYDLFMAEYHSSKKAEHTNSPPSSVRSEQLSLSSNKPLSSSFSEEPDPGPLLAINFKEPPDPSSPFESDSGDSVEANSPIGSHSAIAQKVGNSSPQSYASEGEELNVEPITLQGHISDDAFYQRPKSSKRNKRHPDGPLKVQLRARKGSSSIHR